MDAGERSVALQRRGLLGQGQGVGSFQFCSGPPSGMLVFAFRSLSGYTRRAGMKVEPVAGTSAGRQVRR